MSLKRSPISKISKRMQESPEMREARKALKDAKKSFIQELQTGQSIPAASFRVAHRIGKQLGKKKSRQKMTSIPTWYKGVKHGSQRQVLVYQNFELIEKAGEISHLSAEVEYTLDCAGNRQVGEHFVDIQYFDEVKRHWQLYNVKADYEGSADALSNWKRRHVLKQYPTLPLPGTEFVYPVKYEFFFADKEGGRVFMKDSDLLDHLGQ